MGKEINEISVRYRSGIMHEGSIDGKEYREYEYEYINASTSSVKRYNNAIMLLIGVTGCPHHLIEYLSASMTQNGYVHNNFVTRQSFIAFHSTHKKKENKPYSDHAVIKAFKRLADEGFLIQRTRGVYEINPMMYFSGSEEDRIKSIKYMMEFKAGVDTRVIMEVNRK